MAWESGVWGYGKERGEYISYRFVPRGFGGGGGGRRVGANARPGIRSVFSANEEIG